MSAVSHAVHQAIATIAKPYVGPAGAQALVTLLDLASDYFDGQYQAARVLGTTPEQTA